jgi:hypothetical protein
MKFRLPMAVIVAGLLCSCGVGCSAMSALVAEYRPGTRESRGSADRLVAIGRVFENQGRFDQAEVMYRRALKQKPGDPAIRQQLQELASLKNSRKFGGTPTEAAVAVADSVSGGRRASSGRARVQTASDNRTTTGGSLLTGSSLPPADDIRLASNAGPAEAPMVVAAVTPAVNNAALPELPPAASFVTTEEVLNAASTPNEHVDLLLRGIRNGESIEVRCLSATLLSDCDPANPDISLALAETAANASDEFLILASESARCLRGEADGESAGRLIALLESADVDVQVQAATELRAFRGTPSSSDCVQALTELLHSDEDRVRCVAAVTLGDFAPAAAETVDLLQKLATDDHSSEVRDAAATAAGRALASDDPSIEIHPGQTAKL